MRQTRAKIQETLDWDIDYMIPHKLLKKMGEDQNQRQHWKKYFDNIFMSLT